MTLGEIKENALAAIAKAQNIRDLEEVKNKFLGRQDGDLTKILRSLKDMPPEEKRETGSAANALRQEIEAAMRARLSVLGAGKSDSRLDITRPGDKVRVGHLHPLTLMENRIKEIFLGLNFSVVEGPEIESEHYNFDALNIPPNHPARDMWDTFWLRQEVKSEKLKGKSSDRLLLRTHTSPMQIRYMETHQPPFQIIVPGRVFRFEATDASHEVNFHQVEGLMVGPDVNLANFKYVISEFFNQLLNQKTDIRLRPSYFPFVEPGLEVDIKWKGKWLEVMGAGMVHPNVFDAVHYNPQQVKGFAFGMGLERLAMIKYKIDDIRLFYSGDLRFINQF